MQVVSGRGCPRRPRKGVSKLRMLGNGRKRLCLWLGFIREYIDTETKNRIDTETKNRIDVITGYRVVMVWPLRAARSTVAVRSSHRDTALAPPSVPARLIRCAGHC